MHRWAKSVQLTPIAIKVTPVYPTKICAAFQTPIGAASAYYWLTRSVLSHPNVIPEFVTLEFAVWYQEELHASQLIQAVSVNMSVLSHLMYLKTMYKFGRVIV
jgi:hypothetical protein